MPYYPDSVRPGDPNAPWNQPDPEPEATCEYCETEFYQGDCAFDTDGIGYLCEDCFWEQMDIDESIEAEMVWF